MVFFDQLMKVSCSETQSDTYTVMAMDITVMQAPAAMSKPGHTFSVRGYKEL